MTKTFSQPFPPPPFLDQVPFHHHTYEWKRQEGLGGICWANHGGLQGLANPELLIWVFQNLEGQKISFDVWRKACHLSKTTVQYVFPTGWFPVPTVSTHQGLSWAQGARVSSPGISGTLTLKLREVSSKGILPRTSGAISTSSHFLTMLY